MKVSKRTRHRRWKSRRPKRVNWQLNKINEITQRLITPEIVDRCFELDPVFERFFTKH